MKIILDDCVHPVIRSVSSIGLLLLLSTTFVPVAFAQNSDRYGEGMDEMGTMGGMMGGMGMDMGYGEEPQQSPLERAKLALRKAATDEDRQRLLDAIRGDLANQYDDFLQRSQQELDQMQQRLENLRSQLKRRADSKNELIDLELKRISNEADGLVWPSGQTRDQRRSRRAASSFMEEGMMGMMGPSGITGLMSRRVKSADLPAVERAERLIKLKHEQAEMQRITVAKVAVPTDAPAIGSTAHTLNNLKQIILSCLNYESDHQIFPSNIVAADGTPLLSWRVALLPYLGDEAANLYMDFHLDESWDSEHNRPLIARMPQTFRTMKDLTTKTCVLGFEMKGAMLETNRQIGFGAIFDGSSNTVFCINAHHDLAVNWTKPADISPSNMPGSSNFFHTIEGKGLLALCDGSCRTAELEVLKPIMTSLIRRNDGQVFKWLTTE